MSQMLRPVYKHERFGYQLIGTDKTEVSGVDTLVSVIP